MEIQRLDALLRAESPLSASKPNDSQPSGPDFGAVLNQALTRVEQDQSAAQAVSVKLMTGEVTDVAEVMIASERANLSLSLALQVRNKVLEAYQEIMRTPL